MRIIRALAALACAAPQARALQNGLALTPPRGFSTWQQWPDTDGPGGPIKQAWQHSITEQQSRAYMNGMVKAGLNTLNYTYFIVDEPCFTGRDADGTLLENKTNWPTGLKAFGAELRSHGMKLGIYTCVGPKTCGNCVASEGHEEQDMQTFADWGAEYVKVDSCSKNCTAAAGVANTTTCGKELWSRFTSAIKKTGKDMVYSIIGNCDPARGDQPWKWGKEFANSWRTNIDAQVGWQAVPYLVDCQRRMAGNGSWCNVNGSAWTHGQQVQSAPGDGGMPCPCSDGHLGGACLAPAATQGGPQQFAGNDGGKGGHWNDMDMLMIGSRSALFEYKVNQTTGKVTSKGAGPGGSALTVSQSRTQLSMWAAMKSPLLVSADFAEVATWPADPKAPTKGSGAELIEVLKNTEVLAVSDDPLGMEAVRLEDQHGAASSPDVFVGEMAGGKFVAVMLNRAGSDTFSMTLALKDLKLVNPTVAAGGSYKVRDLWAHTDNGTLAADGQITATVGAYDVVMVTLTPA